MKFHILGPLHVVGADGQPARLEPRQARVLAALLLTANQTVARAQLVDAAWDDAPPTAGRQIQNLVSALRQRVGREIAADGPGYRIELDRGQLDSLVFADRVKQAHVLAGQGEPAPAAVRLRAALALWRGPALAGLGGRLIEAAAAGLSEQRLTALEICIELELAAGRHQELVSELAELVATHPLRETLVGQLMLALHRSGRQADAVAAYQKLREQLADDLGIDAGQPLRERYASILRQDVLPARQLSTVEIGRVPRQLPAPVRHFVGRTAELKELTRLLDDPADAVGTVVISAIEGTGGIGKTALALHWAHRMSADFPDGQLFVNLRGFDPGSPALPPAEALRSLLDAFAVPAARIPAGLDAQAALYRSLLAGRRMLIVLDNANDIDQVRPLLPGSGRCLVLVTSRHRLTGLVAVEGAYPIALDLLAYNEAYELMARQLGPDRLAEDPAAVDALIMWCAGLPLALAIVGARAAVDPGVPLASFVADLADRSRRLDALDAGDRATQVRAVFSWSYERLSPAAARLFRFLGLHPGPDCSVAAAASLAGHTDQETRTLLGELTRAHVLTETVPGRFNCHDLLRVYAREKAHCTEPAPERDQVLHRLLDHYLHTAFAAALLLNPHKSDPPVLSEPASGVRPEGLACLDEASAWFEAERHVLLAAVHQAVEERFDSYAWQLTWTIGNFLEFRGYWQAWVSVQRDAFGAALRLGDRRAQARIRIGLGLAYAQLAREHEAQASFLQALALFDQLGDPAGQSRTCMSLCWLLERRGELNEAMDYARRALAHARAGGDRTGQADALNAIGWTYCLQGHYELALAECNEALGIQQANGYLVGEASTLDSIAYAYRHLGRHDEAIAHYQKALELYRRTGLRYPEADVLSGIGDSYHAVGDRAAAQENWQEALAILEALQHADAEQLRAKITGN